MADPYRDRRGRPPKGPFSARCGSCGAAGAPCESRRVRSTNMSEQRVVFAVCRVIQSLTPSRNALGSRSDWAGRRVKQAGASAVVACVRESAQRFPPYPSGLAHDHRPGGLCGCTTLDLVSRWSMEAAGVRARHTELAYRLTRMPGALRCFLPFGRSSRIQSKAMRFSNRPTDVRLAHADAVRPSVVLVA